jgi:hypothetical protein
MAFLPYLLEVHGLRERESHGHEPRCQQRTEDSEETPEEERQSEGSQWGGGRGGKERTGGPSENCLKLTRKRSKLRCGRCEHRDARREEKRRACSVAKHENRLTAVCGCRLEESAREQVQEELRGEQDNTPDGERGWDRVTEEMLLDRDG